MANMKYIKHTNIKQVFVRINKKKKKKMLHKSANATYVCNQCGIYKYVSVCVCVCVAGACDYFNAIFAEVKCIFYILKHISTYIAYKCK